MLSSAVAVGPQVERAAGVHHAAADKVPGGALHRAWFAGQRRLIQDGGHGGQGAVDRYQVAGGDQQQVAGHDGVQRHGLDRAAGVTPRGPWRTFQQGSQVTLSAPSRPRLQGPPARQHDADHRRGQQFAHRDRAQEGQQRDDIDPETAVAKRIRDRPQRVRRSARPSRPPGGVPGVSGARQVPGRARSQARSDHDQQGQRHVPAKRSEFRGTIRRIHTPDHSPGQRLRPEPKSRSDRGPSPRVAWPATRGPRRTAGLRMQRVVARLSARCHRRRPWLGYACGAGSRRCWSKPSRLAPTDAFAAAARLAASSGRVSSPDPGTFGLIYQGVCPCPGLAPTAMLDACRHCFRHATGHGLVIRAVAIGVRSCRGC